MWQIINALETGASLDMALTGIVDSLEAQIYRDVKNYSSNLNFLLLIYLMVAAVVPSIGVTFLVLLSAFGSFEIRTSTLIFLVSISAVMQLVLIGYMSVGRPEIFGG